MSEMIYSFNGKDITMNVCIQIRDVLKLLQEHFNISFEEAALRFYKSETYKTLQETENGLWAESAEYIADRYCDEIKDNVNEVKYNTFKNKYLDYNLIKEHISYLDNIENILINLR